MGPNRITSFFCSHFIQVTLAIFRVELKFFAKQESSGKPLGANEVIDRMKSGDAQEILEQQGYTMKQISIGERLDHTWPHTSTLRHYFFSPRDWS